MTKKIKDFLSMFKRHMSMVIRHMSMVIRHIIMPFKWIWDKIIVAFIKFICDMLIAAILTPEIGVFLIIVGIFIFVLYRIGLYASNQKFIITMTEKDLQSQKYECISASVPNGYDYNTAEFLARKRMDDKYGIGKYIFVSTNFNGKVWFKTKIK